MCEDVRRCELEYSEVYEMWCYSTNTLIYYILYILSPPLMLSMYIQTGRAQHRLDAVLESVVVFRAASRGPWRGGSCPIRLRGSGLPLSTPYREPSRRCQERVCSNATSAECDRVCLLF